MRQKAILAGLYLSKFDEAGLKALGFHSFREAFNAIGYSINVKPASIKNYRDEFDPYFPNSRKGWHGRNLRDYCKKVMDDFAGFNFEEFTDLLKSYLFENYEVEKFLETFARKDINETVAKRLITGKAAEEYFKKHYSTIEPFRSYSLTDATDLACGFDFKLTHLSNYFCVEVKGLSEKTGSLSMTEKEFFMAQKFRELYCLFVVTNFAEEPTHQLFFDPLNTSLSFRKVERQVVQIIYSTSI